MFGLKIGGGLAGLSETDTSTLVPVPSLTLGAQAGFIIRKFDGRPGFRFMIEPAYAQVEVPDVGVFGGFEIWFTFAAVM
jgi:hypothetical protein